MPIEIKELNIKVNVEDSSTPQSNSPTPFTPEKEAQIIAQCVKQVMQILKDKKER